MLRTSPLQYMRPVPASGVSMLQSMQDTSVCATLRHLHQAYPSLPPVFTNTTSCRCCHLALSVASTLILQHDIVAVTPSLPPRHIGGAVQAHIARHTACTVRMPLAHIFGPLFPLPLSLPAGLQLPAARGAGVHGAVGGDSSPCVCDAHRWSAAGDRHAACCLPVGGELRGPGVRCERVPGKAQGQWGPGRGVRLLAPRMAASWPVRWPVVSCMRARSAVSTLMMATGDRMRGWGWQARGRGEGGADEDQQPSARASETGNASPGRGRRRRVSPGQGRARGGGEGGGGGHDMARIVT